MRDMSRLPQWVQAEIRLRDLRITRLEKRIVELSSEHPGSDTTIETYVHPDVTLPSGSQIQFYLGESREKYASMVTARVRDGALEIMGHGMSRSQVAVSPLSSNHIKVYFTEDK